MTIDLDQRNGIQMASEMAEVYFGRPFASDLGLPRFGTPATALS